MKTSIKSSILFCLLSTVATVVPSTSSPTTFTCMTAESSNIIDGDSITATETRIPVEWVNDNYCDCPLDGMDEPNTSACSGSVSGGWTGITSKYHSTDDNTYYYYTCPRQPKLRLPQSKLQDGVCDCCDGSDELDDFCYDTCDEVLQGERLQKQNMQQEFTLGFLKRSLSIEEFKEIHEGTMARIETMEQEMSELDISQKQYSALFAKYHDEERTRKRKQLVHFQEFPFLKALTLEEMFEFVITVCYVTAGHAHQQQQQDFYYHVNSFISNDLSYMQPLLKALFDMGYTCRYNDKKDDDKGEPQGKVLCDTDTQIYSMQDDNKQNDVGRKPSKDDEKFHFDEGASLMSQYHQYFYEQATWILYQIEKAYNETKLDEDDDDDDDTTNEDAENIINKEDQLLQNALISIDPMAVHTVKIELKERLQQIENSTRSAGHAYGFQVNKYTYYNSAVPGKEVSDTKEMAALIVALLWHSNISSENVADILYVILPEFGSSASNNDALFCPPPTPITRKIAGTDTNVDIPYGSFYSAVLNRCQQRRTATTTTSSVEEGKPTCSETNTCSPLQEVDSEDVLTIPSNVPDGYLGYYQFVPRKESDIFHQKLSSIYNITTDTSTASSTLLQLEEARDEVLRIQSEKILKQTEIETLEEEIGGKDGKFGRDGILYALNEECHELTVGGKYTYEICLFGEAYQRDVGEAESTGTSLGRWKGVEFDDENAVVVLKFDDGAGCWNGPKRSAKVIVACGSETELLTAEEPEICTYVFTMKSHIACDEIFAEHHGLKVPLQS